MHLHRWAVESIVRLRLLQSKQMLLTAACLLGLSACGGGGTAGSDIPVPIQPLVVLAPAVTPAASSPAGGTVAAPSPGTTAPSPAASITLRAASAVVQGFGAAVTVRYNGAVVGSIEVRGTEAAAYRTDVSSAIDGGVLEFVFTNATNVDGTAARYLKIESIQVGSAIILPTDSWVSFDRGTGPAASDAQAVIPGRPVLIESGALRIALPAAQFLGTSNAGASVDATSAASGFYVDAQNGNDQNTGTIAQPWRTLGRLAGQTLQPGQGIFLRCGALWRESLTLNAVQLVDGATVAGYGPECSSRKAVISGADDFSGGWTLNGNIWSRNLPSGTPKINQLFVDGNPLMVARWSGNAAVGSGMALAGSGAASNQQLVLQATEVASTAGKDLVGATVQLRTQPWYLETRTISSVTNGIVNFDSPLEWASQPGQAFMLQDKLWMLDAPGEFFHDVQAQKLYMVGPATGTPGDLNAALIEGSVRDVVLALSQRSNLTLKDLGLRAARQHGLLVVDAPQAQISRLETLDNGQIGIRLEQWLPLNPNAPGPSVTDSLVSGNGLYGIKAKDVQNAVIGHNRVLATGVGTHRAADVQSAIAAGPGASIQDNTVDGSGYLGIDFSARGGSLVSRNSIANYCSRLSDCGAIYTWQGRPLANAPQSATVENNRIYAAQAQLAGAVSAGREVVAGVYLDDFTRNVAVRGNQMSNVPIGVFLHNASLCTIEANQIWLPSLAGLFGSMDQTDADWLIGNVWRNNVIVPLVQASTATGQLPTFSTSQAFWFWHGLSGEAALSADRNSFVGNSVIQLQGPLSAHAWLRGAGGERYVDAVDWTKVNAGEPSPSRPSRFAPVVTTLGPEIVQGGTFTAGLSPWISWQSPASIGFSVQGTTGLSGCASDCVSLTAGNSGDLLASPPFALRTGVPHVYRWTAVMPAERESTVAFPYISRDASPWDVMADPQGFVGYGPRHGSAGEVLSYEVFFVPKSSDPARVNLELETLHAPVAFDNVSVREVTGYRSAQPSDWASLAFAPDDRPRSVGCAELGWPDGCTAIGLDGLAVALPIALPAAGQRLLLRADSVFRR
jgi:hypothetical protein